MADYYNLYQRSIVDEVLSYTRKIYPGQLLSFTYDKSNGPKIVLSIGEWDGKFHCLKLNEVNPNELSKLFRYVLSPKLIDRYEKSIAYGVYDEVLRLNEYQLPLTMPKLGQDVTAQYFYRNVVERSAVLRSKQVYRTYYRNGLKKIRVIVPDLQKLGFLDKTIQRLSVTKVEQKIFLLEGKEIDDYTTRPKFGKQRNEFD